MSDKDKMQFDHTKINDRIADYWQHLAIRKEIATAISLATGKTVSFDYCGLALTVDGAPISNPETKSFIVKPGRPVDVIIHAACSTEMVEAAVGAIDCNALALRLGQERYNEVMDAAEQIVNAIKTIRRVVDGAGERIARQN